MRGKIILEEHVCMPDENPAERLKFFARDPQGIAAALLDLHGDRLDEMNANGVEYAIMSQNPPGPQGIQDPQAAAEYAVRSNDYVARLVNQAPERFAAFAAVSMHDPAAAVAELTRSVKDLGMVGVMLHDTQEYVTADGRIAEYHYDDRRYDEFWKAVEALDIPVYLHPKPPLPEDLARLYAKRPWLMGPTYSFARDTGFHFLALLTSGIFDRFPGLKLIVGHMGEMIPAHLGRIDHWLEKKDRGRTLPAQKALREYFETNVFLTTAGNFSTTALIHGISEVGSGRILFSVDTPYENITEGATWFDNVPISYGDLAKIGRGNALRLFPQLTSRLRTGEVEKLQKDRKSALFMYQAGFPGKL
ncbi:hypothetical protein LTR10_018518 [Elasticomyces elasticus]|uniref:Amidohydrolase-related domain-containing protein n=1 Tax=Exophiala sideris TaxID=1016849 RepID=A0ABR0J1A8_9EURO|nr:hypothetical protein LTR10_018518 [Elasticomyces elasticus]KAK5023889.1 hypothetical protein LTS07_009014 [Exophiala sideris]KAK5030093.1 hypothetical protein LTR13_008406 [Exophiala sideris]KAK5053588.1 hypothetical protein LTR69_009233 [Exophiala sideris]KAK5179369.1 hypothetical protein LTR44_008207 [Eurotiomycetes sp. CCFEE 6388]